MTPLLNKHKQLLFPVKFLLIFGLFICFCSCQSEKNEQLIEDISFGSSTYHSSFLFSKERNDTLTKTLKFNFNDWAVKNDASIEFAIYDDKGDIINESHKRFHVLKNNVPIKDGHFFLSSKETQDGQVAISLVMTPDLSEKAVHGFIKVVSTDLDRINNVNDLNDSPFFSWSAHRQVVWNPLLKYLFLFCVTVVGLLLIWLILLRPIVYRRFSKLSFIIQSPFFKKIPLRGAIAFTLTTNPVKQSLKERIFKGKKLSYNQPFFDEPIVVKPKSKREVFIRLGSGYTMEPFSSILKKGPHEYTITNTSTKEKIKITIT